MAHHLRKKRKKLRISFSTNFAQLLFVAEQKGCFSDENISLDMRCVPYGRKGLLDLIAGDTDIALLPEINIAYLGYMKPKIPIKVFGSVQQRFDNRILLRHDGQEKASPEDLRGKHIGFLPRTTSHSFLFLFLKHHNIDRGEIMLKTVTPQVMPDALMRGEVDAISAWNPHIYHASNAMKELGQVHTLFENPEIYKSQVVLGATKTTLVKRKQEIKKMLNALEKAQTYFHSHKEDVIHICANNIKMSVDAIRRDWHLYENSIEPLDSEYLNKIKILGTWIRENDTEFASAPLPDYSDCIDSDFFLDFLEKTE